MTNSGNASLVTYHYGKHRQTRAHMDRVGKGPGNRRSRVRYTSTAFHLIHLFNFKLSALTGGQTTLLDVVKALGEYLTAEEDVLRTKGDLEYQASYMFSLTMWYQKVSTFYPMFLFNVPMRF